MQVILTRQSINSLIGSKLFKFNSTTQKFMRNEFSTILMNSSEGKRRKTNEKTLKLGAYNGRNLDERTYLTLAWFGLWGKTPDKDAKAPIADQASTTPVVNQTAPPATPLTTTQVPAQANQLPSDVDLSSGYIPEPPPIIDENVILNALGEPTLQSLGLGSSYTPVGWIQLLLENFHVGLGLEWYQAVILFTVILRTLLIPINIRAQRNAAKMRKISPEMAVLNEKLNDAKISGNSLEIARVTHEYVNFMKHNQISAFGMFLPMLQFPFVLSSFIALRKMCKLPVESLTTGGCLWFTDLTISDPYFVLPVLASASILAIVHRGVDTGISAANMSKVTKTVVYGMSAISFPFFIFMPNGVMAYVCTTNLYSLALSVVFSSEAVKRALKIPILTEYDKLKIKESQKKSSKFLAGFKESIQNQKIISEVKEREQLREKQFKSAGTQVPVKTFKTNPKQLQK